MSKEQSVEDAMSDVLELIETAMQQEIVADTKSIGDLINSIQIRLEETSAIALQEPEELVPELQKWQDAQVNLEKELEDIRQLGPRTLARNTRAAKKQLSKMMTEEYLRDVKLALHDLHQKARRVKTEMQEHELQAKNNRKTLAALKKEKQNLLEKEEDLINDKLKWEEREKREKLRAESLQLANEIHQLTETLHQRIK
jgi:hypothetical protein